MCLKWYVGLILVGTLLLKSSADDTDYRELEVNEVQVITEGKVENGVNEEGLGSKNTSVPHGWQRAKKYENYDCRDLNIKYNPGEAGNCNPKYCTSGKVECVRVFVTKNVYKAFCRCYPTPNGQRNPKTKGCDVSESTELSKYCRDKPDIVYGILGTRCPSATQNYDLICKNDGIPNCYCFEYKE